MIRVTYPVACVLQAIANGKVFGFEIVEHTGLATGTVYPILRRLETSGHLKSSWEAHAKAVSGRRPRRRNYELTAKGREALAMVAERYGQHRRVFETEADRG